MFSKLRNLGKAFSPMLLAAGIQSKEPLRDMGTVAAYIAVKAAGSTLWDPTAPVNIVF
ncbi:TfoX/Sxy family DNA transformation protein [Azohydromonas australica]|uniref:TfoX/Sxy family DNA transformation protein n=1 Tax=Azohydromonas australica TaxID=364039 RepID=UPI0003FCBD0E|nr:TfoX/Sxy family DNA transformation protein [Azohydromonas australica]